MPEASDVRLSSTNVPLVSYSFQQLARTPIQARPHLALPPTRISPLHTSSEDRRWCALFESHFYGLSSPGLK